MDQLSEKRRRLLRAGPYSPQAEERFTFAGRVFTPSEIVAELAPLLTEERAARIEQVLDGRTFKVATVVEGLVNLGNVSAVMRSAEALGCQAFHVVTCGESFKDSKRTSQGAEKWLDLHQWETTGECVQYLKGEGRRILVTHLDEDSLSIDDVDFTRPTAVVFGNERDGVSDEMLELADDRIVVPMAGFVQSFNISVAAAVCLYHAFRDRKERQGRHGDLTDGEREELRAVFYLRSVRGAERILKDAARQNHHHQPERSAC